MCGKKTKVNTKNALKKMTSSIKKYKKKITSTSSTRLYNVISWTNKLLKRCAFGSSILD